MKPAGLYKTAANVLFTRRYPVTLVHFVTNRCNARCPHCFIDFSDESPSDIDLQIIDKSDGEEHSPLSLREIDRLTQHMGPCLANVSLTGGEPFLRKDLVKIASMYFSNAGVRVVSVCSNGAFPDRVFGFAEELVKDYPDRQLLFFFSIDDFPEMHDATRKIKDLFAKVLDCCRRLEPLGPTVKTTIAITVSHTNDSVVCRLYRYLVDELGVRSVVAGPARNQGVYHVPPEKKQAVIDNYCALQEQIMADMRCGKTDGYGHEVLMGRLLNRKNQIIFEQMRRTLEHNQYISPCHAGSLYGILDENGDVYPCEILDRRLGNVRNYDFDFMALWRDRIATETRSWIHTSQCFCDHDCAWTYNVLANWRYQPRLWSAVLGLGR